MSELFFHRYLILGALRDGRNLQTFFFFFLHVETSCLAPSLHVVVVQHLTSPSSPNRAYAQADDDTIVTYLIS